jgi:arsenate reductase
LNLLREQGHEPEIVLYLDTPPTAKTLKALLAKLGIGARDLLRKGEDAYKELQLADEKLSEAALIKAMVENPKLIERPIAINGDKAVIGRPPENVLQII